MPASYRVGQSEGEREIGTTNEAAKARRLQRFGVTFAG